MKFRKKIVGITFVGYTFLSSIALTDDVVVGRDRDIPDAQPPTETEAATTENLLQQVLEWLELEME